MRPLLLEHVNINVPNRAIAHEFYVDVLGARVNPRGTTEINFHVNVGVSQFHLPTLRSVAGREPVTVGQRWGGTLELLTCEPLATVAERARAAGYATRTLTADEGQEGLGVEGGLEISGPWDGSFVLRAAPAGLERAVAARRGHAGGSGSLLALACATMQVPPGAAGRLARFYEQTMGLAVEEEKGAGRVQVRFDSGQPGLVPQRLVFQEAEGAPPADAYETDERAAVHIAIYLPDEASFVRAFRRAEAAGLLYVNPRFEGGPAEFGSARTLDEALGCGQFRVKDCVDPQTSELGAMLEHEVRFPQHKAFPLGGLEERDW